MTGRERSSGSSVMRLFIILMSISTLGFFVAAIVLYTLERRYQGTILVEERALEKLQKEASDPGNIRYNGGKKSGSGTIGRELPEYLSARARLTDVADKVESSHFATDKRETRVDYKLNKITIPDLVRFLTRVEGDREDVYLKSLRLSTLNYGVNPPTCSAQATFCVFSEKE